MKPILFLFLCFIALSAYPQKYQSEKLKVNYTMYPSGPLPLKVKTYTVNIENKDKYFKLENDEIKLLQISGFEKVESNGDLEVTLSISGFNIDAKVVSVEKKVKVDSTTVTKTVYKYLISVGCAGNFAIVPKDSTKAIYSYKINPAYAKDDLGSFEFATQGAAETQLNVNRERIINDLKHKSLQKELKSISNFVQDKIGYLPSSMNIEIATGSGKKFDYSDLDNAQKDFIDAISKYNNGDFNGYCQIASNCIGVWDKVVTEYNPDDSKARIGKKNVDNFYMNIVYASLFMNDFTRSLLALNKHDELIGYKSSLYDQIENMEQRTYANSLRMADKVNFYDAKKSSPEANKRHAILNHKFYFDRKIDKAEMNKELLKLVESLRLFYLAKYANYRELKDHYSYIKNEDGYIVGFEVLTPLSTDMSISYLLDLTEYGIITKLYCPKYGKQSSDYEFNWDQGRITEIFEDRKPEYKIEYNNNGKIARIVEEKIGKSPVYKTMQKMISFEYAGDNIASITDAYITAKDGIVPARKYSFGSNIDEETFLEESYIKGEKSGETQAKFETLGDKHYLFTEKSAGGTVIREMKFNDSNLLAERIIINGDKKETYTASYDSEKNLTESISTESKNDKPIKTKIVRKADKNTDMDTRYPEKWKTGEYELNADGVCIIESRDGKRRVKTNGVWSDWHFITY